MASTVKFPDVEERTLLNADGSTIESGRSKFFRKMREQPLVPIGSLATCGALVAASYYLRAGDRNQFQRALRWRVGLQGLTVVAACAGTFYYGSGAAAAPPTAIEGGTGAEKGSSLQQQAGAAIATVPGRPATNHQASRAEERRREERQQLAERLREAESKQEAAEKRRAEEALLRPAGSESGARTRPIIGRDGRDRSAPAASV